ncbi:MAG: Rieske 2Fe-2S domain-containing protein, partial [Actinomycetota bacterium]
MGKIGDRIVAEIGNESILIVRNRENHLRAFYNVCQHRGSQLDGDDAMRTKRKTNLPNACSHLRYMMRESDRNCAGPGRGLANIRAPWPCKR